MFEHETPGHLLYLAMMFITIALEIVLLVHFIAFDSCKITLLLNLGENGKTRSPSEPTRSGPSMSTGAEKESKFVYNSDVFERDAISSTVNLRGF